jgi:hypothetical protein
MHHSSGPSVLLVPHQHPVEFSEELGRLLAPEPRGLPADLARDVVVEFLHRDRAVAIPVGLARSVTVFLDTCYSGVARDGAAIAVGMRSLTIAMSSPGIPDGFTVISAVGKDQFSGDLPGSGHGLFSYYLMLGLQGNADRDGDRKITVSELHAFVEQSVTRQAARQGRDQRPELFGDPGRVLVRY